MPNVQNVTNLQNVQFVVANATWLMLARLWVRVRFKVRVMVSVTPCDNMRLGERCRSQAQESRDV